MSEILAEVVEDVKKPLAGTYYIPRGESWQHLERPPQHFEITAERLHATLLLPRKEAAASLGILTKSSFKRVHRELGVDSWSANDVRNRWLDQSDPAVTKAAWIPMEGPRSVWKEEEDNKVVEHVSCFGTKYWPALVRQLPGRSLSQVRTRWFKQLDPTINKKA